MTDAKNGTNAIELLILPNERRRNDVSHAIDNNANAISPFQILESEDPGTDHRTDTSTTAAAMVVATINAYRRSGCAYSLDGTKVPLSAARGWGKPLRNHYQPTVPFA